VRLDAADLHGEVEVPDHQETLNILNLSSRIALKCFWFPEISINPFSTAVAAMIASSALNPDECAKPEKRLLIWEPLSNWEA
jgi:hypothetical protein